ncbi:glycosyltransferase family 4 protein [Candidatus Electronema sp. PJ]|uniref:glycosyltransferase family 4 protein n=1 Tax=Candidatus Electronema sp. PJ TaxID=3401572 RepID=UPI003AA9AA08
MKPLDLVNLGYIWLKSYPFLRRTWRSRPTEQQNGPLRINYGFERVPGPNEHVFGGMVKLHDLNKVFPHCSVCPDILYLVSSALPYFPVRLAKMARKAGAKIVVNQNGVAYPGWFGKGWERQNQPMARLHALADHVFYQSAFCQLSAERFLGVRQQHDAAEILYNPVDTCLFSPALPSVSDDAIILLLSGSHWTQYRVKTALETLQQVRQVNQKIILKIAGRFCWDADKHQAEQEVQEYARQLGVAEQVVCVGPYTQDEAPALLQSCSILLHTKYNDPCPRLVVEALACGLPVVYSATGGVPELVGEQGGVGVAGPLDWEQDHPPDPKLLADAVLQVIAKLAWYQQGARQRAVQYFDKTPWLHRHQEVFNRLTGKTH